MTDKAIFEFNAPESCAKCLFLRVLRDLDGYTYWNCTVCDYQYEIDTPLEGRDPYCPLKIQKQEEK